MPSILPGYAYDIFISYRHRDNKYDGWVTEFVQNLRQELDAMFKDDISIYFDVHPEDGLLETHNVDKSLELKLNALIFIPILSQTYCDPRSFAWQHEFCAFNKLAKADSIGRDITLRNGNVTSRILPVRVRELEPEDKKMLEDELESVLRPIDFIYREQGVSRPLKSEDSEEKNLNRTKYRNQVNKSANAIKEIISAIRWKQSGAPEPPPAHTEKETQQAPEPTPRPAPAVPKNVKSPTRRFIRWAIIICVVSYFVVGWGKKKLGGEVFTDEDETEIADKSIAVLPFEDLSEAKDQAYFSDGIAEEILNSLAHIQGLKVAGRTSSFQFKGQHTDLKDVGEKLNVATILEGSVRKAGNRVRITAQLIGVKDGYHIWSETYDRDMTDIFAIQDEVASKIAGVLLKQLATPPVPPKQDHTNNVMAYEYYLEGKYINQHQFVMLGKPEDFSKAEGLFKKALSLDSNYALAHAGLADLYNTYYNMVRRDPAYMRLQLKEIDIAQRLNPNLDYVHNALGYIQLSNNDFEKAYRSFLRALELNPNDANNLESLAKLFNGLGLLEESAALSDRAIQIEPLDPVNYLSRASATMNLGRYDDALADLKETVRQQPENYIAIMNVAYIFMIIKKDMPESKRYLDMADKIPHNLKGFTGAEAAYEALLGHRKKALSMPHDWKTYILLGMKEEGVTDFLKTVDAMQAPINGYLRLINSPLIKRVGDDSRIVAVIEKHRKGYLENKAKYKLPDLPK